jgi:3-oxoacyl-[acyl-carrier protein] reductase
MDIRLDGRAALITGGSLGLGRAMAKTFAQSGADVAIVARRAEVLEEARREIAAVAQTRVVPIACDVKDAKQLAGAWERAVKELGKIDILVNNVGTSATSPFEKITDEAWMNDLELKLFSAIRLTRLAWPGMKQRKWGRVINVLNTAAKAPAAGTAPTSVTRAAGMALTKALAGEGAPDGILVNALCTGILVTDQWNRHHKRLKPDLSFDDFVADMGKQVPMGRMGDAQEFANMACFLASDAASYVTGTAINVDGGKSPVV